MTNKMEDSAYWLERMIEARITGNEHQAVYHTDKKTWNTIQKEQEAILKRFIPKGSIVIDVGCGAGYLVDIMPEGVRYVGVDLNPHLIAWAQRRHEIRTWASFFVADAKDLDEYEDESFDWSVSRSVVGCCGVYAGYDVAEKIHAETVRVGKRSLFLGYNPANQFTFGDDPSHPLTLGTIKR
jgi:SAM-dependent methyltransferase